MAYTKIWLFLMIFLLSNCASYDLKISKDTTVSIGGDYEEDRDSSKGFILRRVEG